jgi:hypothetical protein
VTSEHLILQKGWQGSRTLKMEARQALSSQQGEGGLQDQGYRLSSRNKSSLGSRMTL